MKMKRAKLLIVFLLVTIAFSSNAQSEKLVKKSFKVWGVCNMCQERIEDSSYEIEGVKFCRWNISTKIFNVKYDPKKTSTEKIQKAIASIGHDTELYSAKEEDYNNLHSCCKYERKK